MDRDLQVNDIDNSRVKNASRDNRGVLRRQAQPNLLIKIQDIFFLCLNNWKWFVLSLAICLGIAYYQLRKTPNQYSRSASIMIKNDENFTVANATLKELGLGGTSVNVTNEIMALTSQDLARAVAQRLDLDVDYYREAPFHNVVAYGSDLPLKIRFHDIPEEAYAACRLTLLPDSTVIISEIRYNGELPGKVKMKLDQTRRTALGVVSVQSTPTYEPGMEDELLVTKYPLSSATGTVAGRMSAYLRNREATIIDINYVDYSSQRAEDILNMVVDVYNENWVNDQNRINISTNAFIVDRLNAIEQELNLVENRIADYQSENLIANASSKGERAFATATQMEDNSLEIDNKVYMIGYLKDYITDGSHVNQLIPANTGITPSIESQIGEYNRILLQRNGHLAHSSEQNPLVMDLEESMGILQASIIQSLENELVLLNQQREKVEARYEEAVEMIKASPAQTTYVNSIERQRKVKESLYLFLLQKREENELSQAFAAYNSRLIEPPHGSWAPISPVPRSTYTIAFIIGLAIPASILVLKESFNTVVRGRKDIEHLSIPFVGEIPLDVNASKRAEKAAKEKRKRRKKGIHGMDEVPQLLVVEKSRNVMNEAFRVVRSNLEFILGFETVNHIIMVTSLNPSSGKTFCTANLASSLGVNNKRVIAVDLDLRKGNLSKYAGRPSRGVSNYLSGQVADYHSLIVPVESIDILPCGTIPPNPTELLYSPLFSNMIEELSKEYDYVFLDCPPVEVVADAAIINRYAQMTLFVIRAQLLDRTFLPDLERWYEERRYTNLSILLNGTTDAFSRYGYHKYGYRYGYHYGNYGYGYGNEK